MPAPHPDDHPDADADLSAIVWVHEELRRTLEAAHKLLRRFLRETDAQAGSDVGARDLAPVRQARANIHQGAGALSVVGLLPAAQVLAASDQMLRLVMEKPSRLNAELLDKIEQASFAVTDFLGRQLAGKPVSPLLLFPQARALLELGGADRVHPADFWDRAWQWLALPPDASAEPRAADAGSLSALEQLTLATMKAPGPLSLGRMSELCAGLGASAPRPNGRTLWQLAAAVFQAQAQGLLPGDVFSKRLASRLLSQLRGALKTGGQGEAATEQRLAQDLLFFCAQSLAPHAGALAPRLAAVRSGYALNHHTPVDYAVSPLGQFDPATVVQARKRVLAAKDSWSAVAAGELPRLAGLGEQFNLVGDSLRRLFTDGAALADELQAAATQLQRSNSAPRATLAMEVATGLLYIEAALEDADFGVGNPARPIARLAERIAAVRAGGQPEPMEAWMEALYARVSDRQTLGTVVQELRASLASAEQQIDQFFRNPHERGALLPVPGTLQSMRGVLSVLGIDPATQALQHLRAEVESLAAADPATAPEPADLAVRFERMAGNLGALGFLIDMLAVQAPLAKRVFHFDADSGTLAPVTGRRAAPTLPKADAPRLDDIISTRPLARPVASLVDTAAALSPPAPGVDESAPAAPATLPIPVDPEMRAVFVEEAQAVLLQARVALADWQAMPSEPEPVGRLRRAFHTLKGSARMVGLADFAEVAWVAEQRYTARLSDAPPTTQRLAQDAHQRADTALRGWTAETLDRLMTWAVALGERGDDTSPVEPQLTQPSFAPTQPQPLPEPVEALADALAALEDQPLLHLELDLDLSDFEPAPAVVATSPVPVDEPAFDFDLDLELDAESGADGLELPRLPSGFAPLGLPKDLPTADDLSFAPRRAAPPVLAPPLEEPGLAESSELSLDELDQPGLVLPAVAQFDTPEAPPEPAVDLSFLNLDLSEPVTEVVSEPSLQASDAIDQTTPAAEPAAEPHSDDGISDVELPGPLAVQELDLEPDDALLALFNTLSQEDTAGSDIVRPEAEAEAGGEPEAETEPEPEPEMLALLEDGTLDLAISVTEAQPPAEDTSPAPLPSEDDSVKQIGPLRIGIPLFNIYLNEADELSRHLVTVLSEWAMERHLPLPDAAIELAHSLAGSSATVGFSGLCELARALEHALAREQAIGRRGVTGGEGEAALFTDAAEEIRRLLHQFAAGFLKAPPAALLERLAAHEHDSAARLQAFADQPLGDSLPPEGGVPPHDWLAGITALDKVDPELFPIFEEEAQDLLPLLAASLRDWMQQPADVGAADAAMRHLHTFKGGARIAGAMRLGELAHRLESRIDQLAPGGDGTTPSDIEVLLAGSDALQQAFEALRESDAAAYAAADAGVLAQPSPVRTLAPPAAVLLPVAPPRTEPLPVPGALAEPVPEPAPDTAQIDWARFQQAVAQHLPAPERAGVVQQSAVRVRAALLDRMVNQAGEVNLSRARVEVELGQVRSAVNDLSENLERLRGQLRDIELQAETQMSSRIEATKAASKEFDPLEIDRFTRFQELTRMMAESVNDVATVQRTLKRTTERAEDELAAQTRLTRELQADLLRTRMVEFDTVAERLHRVVRQAAKETGKQVRLDIVGGSIELDRGVLDRLLPAFEHLVRNGVTHGIESPARRNASGKSAIGALVLSLSQQGNEVGAVLADDGAGLDLARIRQKAAQLGLPMVDGQEQDLIFHPGFSTADQLTELSGRGVGLDVVRTEVMAVGGRVEVSTTPGLGTRFSLTLPLTTAVTQVLMLRCGDFTLAVPATLVERVRRVSPEELDQARASGRYAFGDQVLAFYWLGALLQHSGVSSEPPGRTTPVLVVRSAQQRLALHVDEVLGHQEAVVKHLGPQLSHLPGLAGMSVLASGAVALIYNPLVLAAVYGESALALSLSAPGQAVRPDATPDSAGAAAETATRLPAVPLVLVVDDSLTVRRVTQRLLVREGYRVQLAKDGLEALERIAQERPSVVLSDIEMPRMDGFELVRALRADAALQNLPVVMISSRTAQKHRDHAAGLGVDHYLGKPYGEEELLALIRSYSVGATESPTPPFTATPSHA